MYYTAEDGTHMDYDSIDTLRTAHIEYIFRFKYL